MRKSDFDLKFCTVLLTLSFKFYFLGKSWVSMMKFFSSWEVHFIHFKMTYFRCYFCKYLLRYELKSECGQIFANFFLMTWVHIKIYKKFIIYSFSFRFSGNVAYMLIINFCYQLILSNLYLWGKVILTSSFTLCLTYFFF